MADSLSAGILSLALEKGALKYGDFVLSSGAMSSYYFDGRLLSLDPTGGYYIGKALLPLVLGVRAGAIGGPTLGADPIVAAVAVLSYLNGTPITAFIVRQQQKEHGAQRAIEGPLTPGSRVVIVDDVCTSGASIFRAIEAAEGHGCTVALVTAVLDRHQGGSEELRRRGYSFKALLEADEKGNVRDAGLDV